MRGLIYSSIAAAVLVTMSGSASAAGALTTVNNLQTSFGNAVNNQFYQDKASITGSFNGASGNMGANSAAGDNNTQNNSVALAAYDETLIFGTEASVAAVISNQGTTGNLTEYYGHENTASLGTSFNGASGNIMANIAAGNNNIQANTMSAVVTTGDNAIATVSSNQVTTGNLTQNRSDVVQQPGAPVTVTTSTSDVVSYNTERSTAGGFAAAGFVAGSASISGGFIAGSLVPPVIVAVGGAANVNYAAAAAAGAAFTTNYSEMGRAELEHVASVTYPIMTNTIVHQGVNNSNIGDGSFNGASGNIGVNMAAGSNNLQANHMSLAVASND